MLILLFIIVSRQLRSGWWHERKGCIKRIKNGNEFKKRKKMWVWDSGADRVWFTKRHLHWFHPSSSLQILSFSPLLLLLLKSYAHQWYTRQAFFGSIISLLLIQSPNVLFFYLREMRECALCIIRDDGIEEKRYPPFSQSYMFFHSYSSRLSSPIQESECSFFHSSSTSHDNWSWHQMMKNSSEAHSHRPSKSRKGSVVIPVKKNENWRWSASWI